MGGGRRIGASRWRSRVPPSSRFVPLVLAVFVIGAGIGALIAAALHQASPTRLVVKQAMAGGSHATSTTAMQNPSRHAFAPPVSGSDQLPLFPGARSSFASLASVLGGQVGIAVAPLGLGPVQTLGPLQSGHAWSTMKAPVLVTLLREYEAKDRPFPGRARANATLALEQSDNAAAETLFAALQRTRGGLDGASAAVQQTLAHAGDETTTVNTLPNDQGFTTWGQSVWSNTGEVTFYQALARGCLLSPRSTGYVLGLMGDVIPSQRWGAGAVGYPSAVPLAFKAGWGPEAGGGYLVRQTAIVGSGDRGYVLSMLALPAGGSFAEGVSLVTSLARWARQHLDLGAHRPAVRCT